MGALANLPNAGVFCELEMEEDGTAIIPSWVLRL